MPPARLANMILRNSLFNLIGLGAPLFVALFTIPVLIDALGEDRFGILTLIWAVVSYFGLFDLGLGRALTLQLSRYLTTHKESECGELVWTALLIMLGLGVVAGVLLFLGVPFWLAEVKSTMSDKEKTEAVFYMALALPFIVLTTGYRGVLESKGAFLLINAIRIPMGIFTFIGPLLVVVYWQVDLGAITFVLFLGRVLGCGVHAIAAHKILPGLAIRPVFKGYQAKPLFSVGGWLTVSNIVSPFMGYVDRFLIGALMSASAVAYYATPNEMITKLWIIPGALTAVLFPHFASILMSSVDQARETFFKAQFWLVAAIFPVCLFLFTYSYELFELWLGAEFASESYVIFRFFCVGILINCMAHIPFTLIQSSGDTKRTAIIHLLELPLFVVLLYSMVLEYGAVGAAIAWCVRMTVDAGLMYYFGLKIVGLSISDVIVKALLWLLIGGLCFVLALKYGPIVGGGLSLLAAGFSAWILLAAFRERNMENKVASV